MSKNASTWKILPGLGLLALAVCGCSGSIATAGSPGALAPPSTYTQEAAAGMQTLQQWYAQSTGVYDVADGLVELGKCYHRGG